MDTTYILTAEMDPESFAWLDGLRREYFPPARNFLPAHLTMFHRLSAEQVDRLRPMKLPSTPVALCFDRVVFFGFGVALGVRSDGLEQCRHAVTSAIGGAFSKQDLQPWKPHVTIQNKDNSERARQLHHKMKLEFAERTGAATALLVWEYLGGPWRLADRLAFSKPNREKNA